jgi:pimeloyl-ACP methyl ester carboxylesterase
MRPILMIPAAVLAVSAAAASLPIGSSQFTFQDAEAIQVFAYKAPTFKEGPLLVLMAGVDRNAETYRNHAIALADRLGALVVAPLFDAERFPSPRYQGGGIQKKGKPVPKDQWTFSIIRRLAAQVRTQEGKPDLPWYLLGHSAGGQVVDRMAGFLPDGPRRIVAMNPGSLLFPTRDLPYGFGFGGLPPEFGDDDALRRYLEAPLTLYLGEEDLVEGVHFDASPTAMRQGATRLARGRACFDAARRLAEARHWTFRWRKVEVPGIGHDARRMLDAPEMTDALFGEGPSKPAPAAELHLDPQRLDAMTGTYQLKPGMALEITRIGDDLFAQGTGQHKVQLVPTGDRTFASRAYDATFVFGEAAQGKVRSLVLTQHGKAFSAQRVE